MILDWHLMSEFINNNTSTAHTAVVNEEAKSDEKHDHGVVEVDTLGLFILCHILIKLVNW